MRVVDAEDARVGVERAQIKVVDTRLIIGDWLTVLTLGAGQRLVAVDVGPAFAP